MRTISACEIAAGTERDGRVYLCGCLARPNGVRHVQAGAYEVGMTWHPEYACEVAHVHPQNHDFCYVLDGEVKVLLLDEMSEHHFRKGDFFVIEPGERHVAKCKAGTRVLFSKVPGGNDKVRIPHDGTISAWGASWDATCPQGRSDS